MAADKVREDLKPELVQKERSGERIVVLGAGSFGTALGVGLAYNGHEVVLYGRDEAVVQSINTEHRHHKYPAVRDYVLPDLLTASSDLAGSLKGSTLILHALPAQISLAFYETNRSIFDEFAPSMWFFFLSFLIFT